MIADYADLLMATGEYAKRNDFAHVFSRLVSLAEGKLKRELRLAFDPMSLPGLTASNSTNWLLAQYPEVYLYAMVREVAIWAADPELGTLANGLVGSAISQINIDKERDLYMGAIVSIGGYTP